MSGDARPQLCLQRGTTTCIAPQSQTGVRQDALESEGCRIQQSCVFRLRCLAVPAAALHLRPTAGRKLRRAAALGLAGRPCILQSTAGTRRGDGGDWMPQRPGAKLRKWCGIGFLSCGSVLRMVSPAGVSARPGLTAGCWSKVRKNQPELSFDSGRPKCEAAVSARTFAPWCGCCAPCDKA